MANIFFCFAQKAELKYKINEDGLYIECIEDTATNRYTIDNHIYKADNKYLITYKYIKNDTVKYFKYVDTGLWDFVPVDSIESRKVVSFLYLTVLPDNKGFLELDSNYNQTVIQYSYFSNHNPNQWIYLAKTGLIENPKNLWLHPPRQGLFQILEFNPFPYIQFPCEKKQKWTWKLEVADHWLDKRWLKCDQKTKL
jgi:hypothetical protein